MSLRWWLNYIIVFALILEFNNGTGHPSSYAAKTASEGASPVVPTPEGHPHLGIPSTSSHSSNTEAASFSRPCFATEDQSSDGDNIQHWVAMWDVQENEVPICLVLRHLWPKLGDMLSANGQSKGVQQYPVEQFMECFVGSDKDEEPETENEATIQEERKELEPGRSTGRAWNASTAMALCSHVAADATCDRPQRHGQRECPNADANGSATTTATSYVVQPGCAIWATLDGEQHASPTAHANHVPAARHQYVGATSATHGTAADGIRGPDDWHESPAEAEQDRESRTEGGESLAGVSESCSCRDEERQSRVLAQFAHSGHCLRQGKTGTAGDGKCTTAALVTMEGFSAAVCEQMERIHSKFPGCRKGVPSTSIGITDDAAKGPEKAGFSKEEDGRGKQRWNLYGVLRRRDRGHGLQGGDRDCQRRECGQNTRRAPSSCHKLGDPVRPSRKTGAQSQKTKKDRGGRRWSETLAQLLAFWQGRRCVTTMYTRPWPFEASIDVQANAMQWGHSILMEKHYISPWQAIENASDLALEVGNPSSLIIDCFSLPKKSNQSKRTVKFWAVVQVFKGDDHEEEFLLSQTTSQNVCLAPWTSIFKKEMTLGDTGSSAPGDQGHHNQQQSSGSAPVYHFLDRSLPRDVPNYIHHLQHLWRERNIRVADDDYHRLRTWYLHHQHVRQWKRPRLVELEGDGSTWHQEILSAWRDQLYNNEVLNIAVVYPDIRAPQDARAPVHADVLLLQGGHDRSGGITTVYPPDENENESYTWAISYPRHLSGAELLAGADADHYLQTHRVEVYHDWTPIATTSTPTHWMLNGHSFVVLIYEIESSAAPGSSTDRRDPAHASQANAESQSTQEEPEESSLSDDQIMPVDQLQGVNIFGLDRSSHHCFVHWDSYNTILFEVLRSMGIPRDRAVGYHYFQVPLIDQHPAEEAILLHCVGDVPAGSADRLVLIDTTFLAAGGDSPLHRREVVRLPRYLGRTGFLQELQLQEQCERSDFQCMIHHNNALWHEDDLAPRQLNHAEYFRVTVPFLEECQQNERERPMKRALSAERDRPVRANPQSTGPVLLQQEMKRHKSGPIAHSAQFPSLHTAQRFGMNNPGFRRHLQQVHEEGWLPQASMTFMECARTELQDEGPVIYWTTWFLHHPRYPRNTESRLLRLDGLQEMWYQDLCDLWADLLDRSLPGHVIFVHPNPPRETNHQHAGHLILTQGNHDQVPALLTGLFDHATNRRIWHIAAFMPQFIAAAEIQDVLGIRRWCDVRACQTQCGEQVLLDDGPVEVEPGESIVVTIAPTNTAHVNDETSLMQTPGPVQAPPSASTGQTALPPEGSQSCLNPNAPIFQPGLHDPRLMSEFLADLWDSWQVDAFAWEDEDKSCTIMTWFVDDEWQQPHCEVPRRVQLYSDPREWEEVIKRRWQDVLVPDAVIELHVVQPRPPSQDLDIAAHVIIIQQPRDTWVTNLVTVLDSDQPVDATPRQIAATTHEHLRPENIIIALNMFMQCLGPQPTVTCHVWCGGHPLVWGAPFQARSGYSITVSLRRHIVIPAAVPQHNLQEEGADGTNLLQVKAQGRRIHLDQLIPHEDPEALETIAMPIWYEHQTTMQPPFVEVNSSHSEFDVRTSLEEWGLHQHHLYVPTHKIIICFDPSETRHLWIYLQDNPILQSPQILHRSDQLANTHQHMKFLYEHGFTKAVITKEKKIKDQATIVYYQDVQPTAPVPSSDHREPTPWPSPQPPQDNFGPIFDAHVFTKTEPNCSLTLDVEIPELADFFKADHHPLHTSIEGFEVPDICKNLIDSCVQHTHIDRLLIYADGSSQSQKKRRPPQWVEEYDISDSWSFAVFGENYQSDKLAFLGFQCQQVLYDPEAPHHLGTDHLGADAAEREALTWAALWRICQNHRLPTIFLTDSMLTRGQACGDIGSATITTPLRLLRGLFQALQEVLPGDQLRVAHTMGHSGDPAKELVDFFAKLEATKSLHLPRQSFDFQKWEKVIPSLWMLLSAGQDVPTYTWKGFGIKAPELPDRKLTPPVQDAAQEVDSIAEVHISFCSANARSLYHQPYGHAGKLQFLRQQMKHLSINVFGLQETRTPAGSSSADNVLRLAGGDQQGQLGVELWVNLDQPFAYENNRPCYFRRQDFVVVVANPRLLLVLFDHTAHRTWFIVAHAPQSGRPQEEREAWLAHLSSIVFQHVQSDKLIILMDANAATGPRDNRHVFMHDDATSGNTNLFQDFLYVHDLCVPSTSSIHEGPHCTWTSPIDDSTYRIDYILVRTAMLENCTHSQVLHDLDLGHQGDHHAVALQTRWRTYVPRTSVHRSPRTRIDRAKITKQALQSSLQQYVPMPWEADIDTQVTDMNAFLNNHMEKLCRPNKAQPKKTCFSEPTWTLRTKRIHIRRKLKSLQQRLRLDILHKVMRGWTNTANKPEEIVQYTTTMLCCKIRIAAQLHVTALQLRALLQADKGKALDMKLQELPPDAPASAVLHHIKHVIGTTNPKKKKAAPLPIINDESGLPCQSVQALRDRWIRFFQNMECGERLSPQALQEKWIFNLGRFQQRSIKLTVQDIPSLLDLEHAFRRVKNNKATGDDGVPSELCHACPTNLARMTYTQLVKLCAHGQEALIHKGGKLVAVYKHKGSQREPSSYRSLMISSHIAKTIHRSLRTHQATFYEKYMQRQQIGGRRLVPVQLGVHMVRAHLRLQAQRGKSSAIIFLDLQEAFYRVLRPLALGDVMQDEAIAAMMQRLSLPQTAIEELARHMEEPGATERAALPAHLQQAINAIHTDTHFHMDGQLDHVRTQAGSRPGDPFADVVFGFLFSRLLQIIEERLQQLQLLDCFPEGSPSTFLNAKEQDCQEMTPYLGPTWMDDLAICISGEGAQELERKAATAAGVLLEVCAEHGVTPNLSRGKTEILLSLRGTGSRHCRRRYFSEQQGKQMEIVQHCTAKIAVVGSYIHLGGRVHHSGESKAEARRRIGIANEAFSTHRRQLFQNPKIAVHRRRELFNTLILSKLSYGLESWTFATQSLVDYVHGAVIRLYKRFLRIPADQHVDDFEVLARAGMPSPKTIFRRAGLRYLLTLLNCESSTSWGLLSQDTQWQRMITDDMEWLWQYVCRTSSLRDPRQHPEEWLYIMRYHKKYWKTLVQRATCLDIQKNSDQWQLRVMHATVFDQLAQCGELSKERPIPECSSPQGYYGRIACRKRCRTKAGEAAHMFRCHGHTAEFRQFCDTTACPACLREYHPIDRVHAHLRHSHTCQAKLRGMRFCRPLTPGIGSRTNFDLKQRHDGLLPYQVAEGPQPAPQAEIYAIKYHLDLYEHIALILFEHDMQAKEEVLNQLYTAILTYVIPWTSFVETVQQLKEDFTEENCVLAGFTPQEVQAILCRLCEPDNWPFLHDAIGNPNDTKTIAALDVYEVWCEQLALDEHVEPWRATTPRPTRVFAEKVILHAYSGRRRQGDLQWFLEECAGKHPEVILHVVSLDIVIDAHHGDISKEEVRNQWYHGMREGYVAGFLSGPPCCTWSKARGKVMTDRPRNHGPRVLRDADHLWGYMSVSLREMAQLSDGHCLLGFSVTAMTILATTGGSGVLEHPAEPEEPELASIWKLPLLQLLSRLPGMTQLTMAQGLLGAPSPKPTGLLALNLPGLPQQLVSWAVSPELPKGRSIGVDATGTYKTAGLKEYPPAMCAALAHSFFQAIQTQPVVNSTQNVPPAFLDMCASMVCHDLGDTYGPDCVLWGACLIIQSALPQRVTLLEAATEKKYVYIAKISPHPRKKTLCQKRFSNVYIYIYMHICTYICIYVYVFCPCVFPFLYTTNCPGLLRGSRRLPGLWLPAVRLVNNGYYNGDHNVEIQRGNKTGNKMETKIRKVTFIIFKSIYFI